MAHLAGMSENARRLVEEALAANPELVRRRNAAATDTGGTYPGFLAEKPPVGDEKRGRRGEARE